MRLSAAIPAAIGVAHGAAAIHGPVVEWAGQRTIHPTGDPRGPTYGSEGGGLESFRARQFRVGIWQLPGW